jgi:U4/U6.U5 tri-snRNP-associated protein 1
VHKPSQNWSESKRQRELKEKLDTKRKQRDVYGKVLKAKKGLAEDSDDEEGTADTVKWVERNRKIEEEMRRAQARAKQLDEMDEAFGIGGMIQAEQQKQRQKHGHQKVVNSLLLTTN